jgi:hypothetical protein
MKIAGGTQVSPAQEIKDQSSRHTDHESATVDL